MKKHLIKASWKEKIGLDRYERIHKRKSGGLL